MSAPRTTNDEMDYLRVRDGQTIRTSALDQGTVTATRLTRDTPNHGFVDQHVTEDAFMMSVQLRDYRGELWVDGRNVALPVLRRGQFSFYDYNRIWQANMKSDFDCVNFHIPRAALTDLQEDLGPRRIETLDIAPGASIADQAVLGLVQALLPAFAAPDEASMLFVDHVGLALCLHVTASYGAARPTPAPHPAGLAPWQLARAKEMIDAQLDGNLQVAQIARACRLSPSHFARAFKLSAGMPPHQWMMRRRIDKAMSLMRGTALPLSDVALACGFTDQSHFTRIFSRSVGMSPGSWRKAVRS
ncbi:helix-turn-helix domain-containing protein [Marinibacterium sp. SX1]|uniref:helix-turn-helix domain-containing protein n=1 Tax=Marinibacterium sp. SX1 TaxID=3388424 RepID=UPI003D17B49F